MGLGLRVRARVVGDLERDDARVARAPYTAVLVPGVYGDLHVRARARARVRVRVRVRVRARVS